MTTTEPTSRTRSRLLKGGGAVLGVAAIGIAASLTAANWTDDATVQGDVTTGEFTITITEEELDFDEFNPSNAEQTSNHTLNNNSTSPATITLEPFPDLTDFNVEVLEVVDPDSEEEAADLTADESFEVAAGGEAEIAISLTLTETDENPGFDDTVLFEFLGTQVTD